MLARGRRRVIALLAGLVLASTVGWAGEIARVDRLEPYDLRVVGFELPRDAAVRIEAQGLGIRKTSRFLTFQWRDRDDDTMLAYAWLLDARTRRPVWTLDSDNSEPDDDNSYLLRADHRLDLPAGPYELYYFSGLEWLESDESGDEGNESWWSSLFGSDQPSGRQVEDALESGYVTVSAEGLTERDAPTFEVIGSLPDALILQQQLGDSTLRVSGFKLDRVADLRVYGLIEKAELQPTASDFGWIVNAITREVVWNANDAKLEKAGGAAKNQLFDESLRLQPGSYLVYYGTDSSHSYERFNAPPPHDPFNWGITILPGAEFVADAFGLFEPAQEGEALIEIKEVGVDETIERAFRMNSSGSLHVLALGEYDEDDGKFYDDGWIVDASTGETVWRLTGRNTMGAGGCREEPTLRRPGRVTGGDVRGALRDRRFTLLRWLEPGGALRAGEVGHHDSSRPRIRSGGIRAPLAWRPTKRCCRTTSSQASEPPRVSFAASLEDPGLPRTTRRGSFPSPRAARSRECARREGRRGSERVRCRRSCREAFGAGVRSGRAGPGPE